jgi:hypothetical protein
VTHAPARHVGVEPEQAVPEVQLPTLLQERGTVPWQSELPGTQAVQSPPMQAVEQT